MAWPEKAEECEPAKQWRPEPAWPWPEKAEACEPESSDKVMAVTTQERLMIKRIRAEQAVTWVNDCVVAKGSLPTRTAISKCFFPS